MSTPEENKRTILRILAAWNIRNLDAFYAGFDPCCDFSSLAEFGLPPTLESFKLLTTSMLTSFPDVQNTIEAIVAEGDTVVVRVIEKGTHRGTWQNIPATNKQVAYTEIVFYRFTTDGKIVEWKFFADMLGILNQIGGALPA
jgi:predicted ester cyclase